LFYDDFLYESSDVSEIIVRESNALYESSDVLEIDDFCCTLSPTFNATNDEPEPEIVVVRESNDAMYESNDVSEIDDFSCT
jgi:hypothetical protein